MSPGRVRPATPADAGVVADLEDECLGADAWSAGLVAEAVGGTLPTIHVLVVELDRSDGTVEVAGYAGLSAVEEVSELQRLAVSPRHRRAGLASLLLDHVARVAAGAGAQRLLLEVREDNAGSRAFYAAGGFTEIARRARYYRDGAAAVVLERALGATRPETKRCTRA